MVFQKGENVSVKLVEHPLVQHKIAMIRDKNTGSKDFRELVEELSTLMCYEATRTLQLEEVDIETPLASMRVRMISGKKLGLVPILRAGLGMLNGILHLLPTSKVGHLGLYRDPETLQPVEYYAKLPEDINEREMIILDPMLATAGSAIAAVNFLKNKGAKSIKQISLIASKQGIKRFTIDCPDVDLFVAAIDDHLNDHAYIVPGLGDAGDRLFGTK